MIFSSLVPSNLPKGVLLIDYLAGRFTYYDHQGWQSLISAGKIACNGKAAGDTDTVVPGDTISYDAGEFEEPPADLSYRIIYEDPWFLGIDKPGNLLVHRAGKSFRNNLIYQLRETHVPPYPTAHSIHRLDRETSGVLLVAKNSEVIGSLSRGFNDGKVEKIYMAVVHGHPATQEINLPIGKASGSSNSCKFDIDPAGKTAETLILDTRPLNRHYSLVTLQPVTGRTHQIRVHLAAIGAPVVGDKLYIPSGESDYFELRNSQAEFSPELKFRRQALHCASITFLHPFLGSKCKVAAEMRADMRELIEQLTRMES